MPTYDYQCNNCEHIFEIWQGMDDPDPECPLCTCPQVTRLISAVTIHTGGDATAERVEREIKCRLGQCRPKDALKLAEKAVGLAGHKRGMSKIKAAREKLRGHLSKLF